MSILPECFLQATFMIHVRWSQRCQSTGTVSLFHRKMPQTFEAAVLSWVERGEESVADGKRLIIWQGGLLVVDRHVDPSVEASIPCEGSVGATGHFFEILASDFSNGDS